MMMRAQPIQLLRGQEWIEHLLSRDVEDPGSLDVEIGKWEKLFKPKRIIPV
jgi:hypothetical protein